MWTQDSRQVCGSRCPKSWNLKRPAIREKFSLGFPVVFPEFSLGTFEAIPETATAFWSCLRDVDFAAAHSAVKFGHISCPLPSFISCGNGSTASPDTPLSFLLLRSLHHSSLTNWKLTSRRLGYLGDIYHDADPVCVMMHCRQCALKLVSRCSSHLHHNAPSRK